MERLLVAKFWHLSLLVLAVIVCGFVLLLWSNRRPSVTPLSAHTGPP